MKNSQLSVFVSIALLLILISLLAINYDFNSNNISVSNQKNNVNFFIDSCFKNSYFDTIRNLGVNSGYYLIDNISEDEFMSLNLKKFLYFENGKTNLPSKNFIQTEISKGVMNQFSLCLKNSSYDLSFNFNPNEFETLIQDGGIYSISYSPIKYSDNKESFTLSRFSFQDSQSSFLKLYNFSIDFSLEQSNYSDMVCNSCLLRESNKYDVRYIKDNYYIGDDIAVFYTVFLDSKDYEFKGKYNFIHYFSGDAS